MIDPDLLRVWPSVVPPELCDELAAHSSWPKGSHIQQIVADKAAADYFAAELTPFVPDDQQHRTKRFTPYVTYTRSTRPVSWHYDEPKGSSHKLYVYLNDSAGTIFDRKALVRVNGTKGTMVLFDVDLEHCGAEQEPGPPKLVLGLRPVTTRAASPARRRR